MMWANYWRVTWQCLQRQKLYTLLNVLGLSIAIASSIIIFLYSRHELSWDVFHENADRIQLVYKERNTATGIQELDDTWVPLLGVITEQVPGVATGARVFNYDNVWVETDGREKVSETVTYADPAALDMFSFPLARGDSATALNNRNNIILSVEAAARYFGADDPLGKTLTLNFDEDFLVTGVMAPVPRNSTLRPDFLAPFASLMPPVELEAMSSNWGNSFLETYLLLESGVTQADLEARFPSLVESLFGSEGANGTDNMTLKLWSLRSLHDQASSSNTVAWVMLGIAFSIILLATFNFMNLSIARAFERAREVGVRFNLGSARGQLVLLFFIEPLLISLLALALAVEGATALLPVFNSWYGLDLTIHLWSDPQLLLILLAVAANGALLSGCYPALVLSSLRTVDTLKGNLKSSSHGIHLRNGLTFMQFALATILVTGIIAVWMQIRYMQNRELNFDPGQVLVIPVQLGDFADSDAAPGRLAVFRSEISSLPGVASVAGSYSVPGNQTEANIFATPEGWDQPEPLRVMISIADDAFFTTYGMRFLEGENFSSTDNSPYASVILNETAMHDMGWTEAVGKQINDGQYTVVGVVRDYHYQTLDAGIRPIIHMYEPALTPARLRYLSIKLSTSDLQGTLAAIEAQWRQLAPDRNFNYWFIEDRFEALYRDINNAGKILGYFTLLSIVIANLGLLGISSYSVIQRIKEIGIRKVFGGSSSSVAMLLSGQFVRPVLLANLLAWPLAWFAINRWLDSFAYQVELNWLIFPLGGLCILLCALLTVAAQSISAAGISPVRALRYE